MRSTYLNLQKYTQNTFYCSTYVSICFIWLTNTQSHTHSPFSSDSLFHTAGRFFLAGILLFDCYGCANVSAHANFRHAYTLFVFIFSVATIFNLKTKTNNFFFLVKLSFYMFFSSFCWNEHSNAINEFHHTKTNSIFCSWK